MLNGASPHSKSIYLWMYSISWCHQFGYLSNLVRFGQLTINISRGIYRTFPVVTYFCTATVYSPSKMQKAQ